MQTPLQISNIDLASYSLKYYTKTDKITNFNQDIIPGIYQGGFKLWECTLDMLKYLEMQKNLFQDKKIIEMGCGHGLLGILARKMGAKEVCLQDYNQQVIQNLTKPTVQINGQTLAHFSFLNGDWSSLKCLGAKFDVILGSELIYSEANYQKIITFILNFLSPTGICILGNKHYYFGVGGNMPNFKKAVQQAHLQLQSLVKLVPPKGGNKKEIVKIYY